MEYTVHQAKTNLSKILREVEAGKEVTISRGKKPVAKIVPVQQTKARRVPGTMKGKFKIRPSFFDPMTEDELKDWGY